MRKSGKKKSDLSWGRRAALRFAKTPEEIRSEILKSLQGKLSVEFQAYAQWERVKPEEDTDHQQKQYVKKKKKTPKEKEKALPDILQPRRSCSALCLHPWQRRQQQQLLSSQSYLTMSRDAVSSDNLKILQMQVKAKAQACQNLQELKKCILVDNMRLQEEIVECERSAYDAASADMRRGEAYLTGGKLRRKFHHDDVEQAQLKTKQIEEKNSKLIAKMEKEVKLLDKRIAEADKEIQVLRSYKDTQYPSKEIEISHLMKQLKRIDVCEQGNGNEVRRVAEGELRKMDEERHLAVGNIVGEVVARQLQVDHHHDDGKEEEIMTSGSAKLKNLLRTNAALRTEIEKQRESNAEIESELLELQRANDDIVKSGKHDLKKVVFHHVHKWKDQPKCQPDEELVLDIPRQVALPL